MNEVDYEKIIRYEKRLLKIPSFVIPVFLGILIFVGLLVISSSDYYYAAQYDDPYYYEDGTDLIYTQITYGIPVLSLIPIIYFPIFITIFGRKIKDSKAKISSTKYFSSLGFERAVIRHNLLDNLHRYYIIVLIIVAFFIGFGLGSILQSIHEEQESFKREDEEYKKKIDEFAEMPDEQIIVDARRKILGMDIFELRDGFRDKEHTKRINELEKSGQSITLEIDDKIWEEAEYLAYEKTENELRQILLEELKLKSVDELRATALEDLQYEKPSLYYYDDPFLIMQQDFLVSIVSIPGAMVYSVFLFKMSLRRKSDFWFNSTIGCFKIVKNFKFLDEMEKRRYIILGLKHYDNYLKRHLKMRIKDLEKINSAIISDSNQPMEKLSETILEKLESGEKTNLLSYLGSLLNRKSHELLVSPTLFNSIEGWGAFVISILTIVISILAFLFQKPNV